MRRGRSLRSLWDWRQSRSALMPIAVLAVLLSAQLLAAVTLHPVYRAQGDVPRHMFWQGLLSSLQLEPEWDKKYGASVNGATDDAMPAQVARIAIMKLPPEERQQYLRPRRLRPSGPRSRNSPESRSSTFCATIPSLWRTRFSSTSRRELGNRNGSFLAGFSAACRSGTRSYRLRRSYFWWFWWRGMRTRRRRCCRRPA